MSAPTLNRLAIKASPSGVKITLRECHDEKGVNTPCLSSRCKGLESARSRHGRAGKPPRSSLVNPRYVSTKSTAAHPVEERPRSVELAGAATRRLSMHFWRAKEIVDC